MSLIAESVSPLNATETPRTLQSERFPAGTRQISQIIKSHDIQKEILYGFLKAIGITENIELLTRVEIDMDFAGSGIIMHRVTGYSQKLEE